MALHRRFFTELAHKYRDLRPVVGADQYSHDIWESMVRVTAASLAAQSGMFNYERFYEACGVPSRTPVL